jgi:recombination protein RecA
MYGQGISREGDLIDIAVNNNIVEKSGSWFSYKGERVGQGRENAKQFLKDNKDITAQIEVEVKKVLGLIKAEVPEPAPASPVEKATASAAVARAPEAARGPGRR